jgi:hypothetical protein
MGAFKPFSSDRRDYCTNDTTTGYISIPNTSTPDPTNFEIKKKITINGYPIFWVQYPDVENYEGNKILVYPKHFNTEIIKDRMDPHFFTRGDSPIARFEPTAYGWLLAKTLTKNL